MTDNFSPINGPVKIRGQILQSAFAGWALGASRCSGNAQLAYSNVLQSVPLSSVGLGTSVNGLQFLGEAPMGVQNAELRVSANITADRPMGIVRWGYHRPDVAEPTAFVEMGWDAFRSSGRYISEPLLPIGRRLAVYARWYVDGAGWVINFS